MFPIDIHVSIWGSLVRLPQFALRVPAENTRMGDGLRQTAMDHLDSDIAAGIDAVLLPLPLPLQISLLERQNADLVTQLAENQRTVAAAAEILKRHEDRMLAEEVAQQAAVKESVAKKKKVERAAKELESDEGCVIRRWPYCPGREAVVSILLYSAKSKSAWCTREQRFGDVKHYIRMFDVIA